MGERSLCWLKVRALRLGAHLCSFQFHSRAKDQAEGAGRVRGAKPRHPSATQAFSPSANTEPMGERHTHIRTRGLWQRTDLLSRNLIWSQKFHTVSYFMLNEKFRQEHAKGFYTHNHCKIFNYTALPQSELKMQAERSRFRLRHKNLPGPINKLINKVTH